MISATVTAGELFNLQVTAYDTYGNVKTDFTGTIGMFLPSNDYTSPNGQAAILPSDYPFTTADNGQHTFTGLELVKADPTGNEYIWVYDADQGQGGINSPVFMTVNPAAAASLVISPHSSAVDAGQSQTYSAVGYDLYGNSLGSVSPTYTCTDSNLNINGNSATTNIASAYTVNANYLGATDQATLTVNPALSEIATASPSVLDYDQIGSITLSVTQSSGTGPYTYDWQYNYDNSGWTDQANSRYASVSTSGLPVGTYAFQVIVKDATGAQVTFNAGTVTISPALSSTTATASQEPLIQAKASAYQSLLQPQAAAPTHTTGK